jgi:acetyltransferase-like isoleucine patch superfamily enzyme
MINLVFSKLIGYYKFYQHKKEWRKHNSHNLTVAIGHFPINKVKVGNYSYGDLKVISYGEHNEGLEIGHYVSIANGVQFLLGGNHYYRRFSSYPFQAKFGGEGVIETWSKGKIIVGDDVWIGTEAFIMPGVNIGRGAIIGARAIVTQNIPPYAIAAGNPATVIKYRFDEQTIDELKRVDFSKIKPQQVLPNLALYQDDMSSFDKLGALLAKDI